MMLGSRHRSKSFLSWEPCDAVGCSKMSAETHLQISAQQLLRNIKGIGMAEAFLKEGIVHTLVPRHIEAPICRMPKGKRWYKQSFFIWLLGVLPTWQPETVETMVTSASPLRVSAGGSQQGSLSALPIRVGPSVLAGDLSKLAFETRRVIRAGADYIHLDMFDGNWVQGAFTFGPMVVKALRDHEPRAYFDVHLCVMRPEEYLEEMKHIGVSRVTLHFEATRDPGAAANRAHGLGLEIGLALAPETQVDEKLLSIAELFDVVLVMTVPPGFGGQSFMPEMLPKLRQLREVFPTKALEVDGGVTPTTAALAAAAGANEAVAGSSVFHSRNLRRAIRPVEETS